MTVSDAPRAEATPPRSIGFVWQEGIRLIDSQHHEAADLDAKTSALIGLLTAVLALIVSQLKELGDYGAPLVLEVLVALTYLLFSFSVRRFGSAPTLTKLSAWANERVERIQTEFAGNLVQSYEHNELALSSKATYFRWAMYAIIVFAMTSMIALLNLRTRPGP